MKVLTNHAKKRYVIYALLITMGIVVALLTSFYPLRYDDLMYQYVCMDMGGDALHFNRDYRIESLGDALASMKNWYFLENGRLLVHFIVQCFCGFFGKAAFNVVNGIVYACFLYGCLRLLKVTSISGSIITIGALWLALPVQYIFTVAVAYAVNYLWVATLMVYFLLAFRYYSQLAAGEDSWLKLMLLLGFGLLTGATHEGFMLPLSMAMILYVVCYWRRLNKPTMCLIIGLWIGVASVVFAPATIQRSSDSMAQQSVEWVDWLMLKAHVLIYSKRFLLLLGLLLITLFVQGRQTIKGLVKDHMIAFVTIIGGLLFVAMLPHYSQRMVFPVELLSVLLILELLRRYAFLVSRKNWVCILIALLMVIHVPMVVGYSSRVASAYDRMIDNYVRAQDVEPRFESPEIPKTVFPYIKYPDDFEYKMICFDYDRMK